MPTDKKTVASYNKYAEKWAAGQRNNTAIYHLYLEKPAIYSKLPPLENKTVLCLGCGSGEEVEFINSQGVKRVVGIDISEKLIEIAKKSYPGLEFYVMDAEHLDFPANSFDLVFSSLTMHYLNDWSLALKSIHNVLKQDCTFLFSMTHPFFSAMQKADNEKVKSRILGYNESKDTDKLEIYGNYLDQYSVPVSITNQLSVTNFHRPLSAIISDITKAGFKLMGIVEPKALDESKKENPKFWKIHQKIPEFIIFELRKN